MLAREQDRVPGGKVLADVDGRRAAGGTPAGVRHHGGRAVDHAPAGGPRARTPVDLLVIREEGLVEEADVAEGAGAEPHGAAGDPLDVALARERRSIGLARTAEGDEALAVRHPSPGEPEPARVLAGEHLRPDDGHAGIRGEHPDGRRGGSRQDPGVVVQQQHGIGTALERGGDPEVRPAGVAEVLLAAQAHDRCGQRPERRPGAVVHHDDVEPRLGREALEAAARVLRIPPVDDDGGHSTHAAASS